MQKQGAAKCAVSLDLVLSLGTSEPMEPEIGAFRACSKPDSCNPMHMGFSWVTSHEVQCNIPNFPHNWMSVKAQKANVDFISLRILQAEANHRKHHKAGWSCLVVHLAIWDAGWFPCCVTLWCDSDTPSLCLYKQG